MPIHQRTSGVHSENLGISARPHQAWTDPIVDHSPLIGVACKTTHTCNTACKCRCCMHRIFQRGRFTVFSCDRVSVMQQWQALGDMLSPATAERLGGAAT